MCVCRARVVAASGVGERPTRVDGAEAREERVTHAVVANGFEKRRLAHAMSMPQVGVRTEHLRVRTAAEQSTGFHMPRSS